MDEKLPDKNTCCDTIGKPLHADADASLYTTSSSYIGGGDQQVRFHWRYHEQCDGLCSFFPQSKPGNSVISYMDIYTYIHVHIYIIRVYTYINIYIFYNTYCSHMQIFMYMRAVCIDAQKCAHMLHVYTNAHTHAHVCTCTLRPIHIIPEDLHTDEFLQLHTHSWVVGCFCKWVCL